MQVIPKRSLLESADEDEDEEMEVVISPRSFTSIDLLMERSDIIRTTGADSVSVSVSSV